MLGTQPMVLIKLAVYFLARDPGLDPQGMILLQVFDNNTNCFSTSVVLVTSTLKASMLPLLQLS